MLSALPSAGNIQEALEDNEALLLDTTFSGARIIVCVRSEDIFLGAIQIEDTVQFESDRRLINLAIRANYSPDLELDRQFPVRSSMRLYKQLLGPTENCLNSGDTVYVAARSDGFPLELLLGSEPTAIPGGYDLSTADRAIRHFNFAYVGTALEFLAGKRIDNAGRAAC